jgi:hypothetical protein
MTVYVFHDVRVIDGLGRAIPRPTLLVHGDRITGMDNTGEASPGWRI